MSSARQTREGGDGQVVRGDDGGDAPQQRRRQHPPPPPPPPLPSSSSVSTSPCLVLPTQTSPWYSVRRNVPPPQQPQQRRRTRRPSSSSSMSPKFIPSTVPSYGSSSRLGGMRRQRREHEYGGDGVDGDEGSTTPGRRRGRSSSLVLGGGGGGRMMMSSSTSLVAFDGDKNNHPSPSRPLLLSGKVRSNPFLRKPIGMSSESLPLLYHHHLRQSSEQQTNGMHPLGSAHPSMRTSGSSIASSEFWGGAAASSATSSAGVKGAGGSLSRTDDATTSSSPPPAARMHPSLHAPPVPTHGHVERHLGLIDLIAVGVGGTLGTGFFLLCGLLTSTYAGPSSIFCWLLSAIPALLSGFCFAELAGQVPAAGSTYAYAYASMGELPAVVAAGCLSLEYLVSASAIARGWGDKMVVWALAALARSTLGGGTTMIGHDDDDGTYPMGDDGGSGTYRPDEYDRHSWAVRLLRPGWNFNPLAFLLAASTSMLLLNGVKESKAVTNYVTAFMVASVVGIAFVALGLLEARNLSPFLPPALGINGFFAGGTVSFMGYLGFDEVSCFTAEAIEPQRNMPRAIMYTIAILTVCYMIGTFALSGMLPYDTISPVGGFPDAFEARDIAWASTAASLGELVFLPLAVLVALMAQPRLTFALACDGLMPPWFGIVDDTGNMRNGTLFAGALMTLIASFVRLKYLNDFISAGVLVAFSMTNSSLVLMRHESPDDDPGLLERSLACFNAISFVSGLLLTRVCTSKLGMVLTGLCCLASLSTCVFIKRRCPAAPYFGGKTRRATTQHMTVGVVSVEEEYFRAPLVPYLPLLGIAVNWYLVAQLPWTDLAFLILFLSLAVAFYFSFGYYFSVGNNGGWDAYESCGLSIHTKPSQCYDDDDDGETIVEDDAECDRSENDDGDGDSEQGLPIEDGDDVSSSDILNRTVEVSYSE
ncbi:hypothetical protein ACHAXA_006276 [Cyclostephanos tholiformis]|uniref:Cationic amino acid transporter C-terminal domain-containing protein n=1 Tax=Cyclostephanos tholiformis TaxID=382380 RepID=A0ABD3SPL4_9STRA